MSLPLAAFSASTALFMAAWADPLASATPAWVSSMRTSLRFTRSWVFSTSVARVSTFWLTAPTSLATCFLVAQPVATTARTTITGVTFIGTSWCFWAFESAPILSGPRHVAASGADHDPLARGLHEDLAEAVSALQGDVSDSVLVLELVGD